MLSNEDSNAVGFASGQPGCGIYLSVECDANRTHNINKIHNCLPRGLLVGLYYLVWNAECQMARWTTRRRAEVVAPDATASRVAEGAFFRVDRLRDS